jgi:hypothetical protein
MDDRVDRTASLKHKNYLFMTICAFLFMKRGQ